MSGLFRSLLILGLAIANPALASSGDPESPRERFRAGVEAFEAGELERSRDLLEQAWQEGVDTLVLHYNLGVVHYKLGNYTRAEAHFGRLLDTSQRHLALYNLGLVARADGRETKAAAYFRQVIDEADKDALKRLARARLEPEKDKPADEPEPSLDGLVSVSAGYEDNISRLPDTGPARVSDSFSDALLVVKGKPLVAGRGDDTDALEVSLAGYRRHYHSEPDYRSDFGRVGLSWVNRSGKQQSRIGVQQAYLRFGGESRQWQSTLHMRYRLDSCLGAGANRCELNLEGTRITPYSGFDSREGERYRAGLSYRQRENNWEVQYRYRGELNNRRDFRAGNFFISHSPRRQKLSTSVQYHGFGPIALGGEAGYRYSDYPDPFNLGTTATGERRDHRYELEFSAEWIPVKAFSVKAETGYTWNDSSLQRFDYDNRVVQISLRYRL